MGFVMVRAVFVIAVDDIERHDVISDRRFLVVGDLVEANFSVRFIDAYYPYTWEDACQKEENAWQNPSKNQITQ